MNIESCQSCLYRFRPGSFENIMVSSRRCHCLWRFFWPFHIIIKYECTTGRNWEWGATFIFYIRHWFFPHLISVIISSKSWYIKSFHSVCHMYNTHRVLCIIDVRGTWERRHVWNYFLTKLLFLFIFSHRTGESGTYAALVFLFIMANRSGLHMTTSYYLLCVH